MRAPPQLRSLPWRPAQERKATWASGQDRPPTNRPWQLCACSCSLGIEHGCGHHTSHARRVQLAASRMLTYLNSWKLVLVHQHGLHALHSRCKPGMQTGTLNTHIQHQGGKPLLLGYSTKKGGGAGLGVCREHTFFWRCRLRSLAALAAASSARRCCCRRIAFHAGGSPANAVRTRTAPAASGPPGSTCSRHMRASCELGVQRHSTAFEAMAKAMLLQCQAALEVKRHARLACMRT